MRIFSLPVFLLVSLFLSAGAVLGDVYKYRDAEGRIYLTDKPMHGNYKLLKRFGMGRPQRSQSWAGLEKRKRALDSLIARVAKESRLRPALVHAVVRAESGYRSDAVSKKGAMGLMQLMPATAARFGVRDAYDPHQNLRGGTRYLRQLLEMFEYDLRLALAAYNAGENAVISYGNKVPPYPETQRYVEKVLGFYRENRSLDRVAALP